MLSLVMISTVLFVLLVLICVMNVLKDMISMTNTFVLYQKLNVMMNTVKNVQVVLNNVIHVLKDTTSSITNVP